MIRKAQLPDLPAITAIYNQAIEARRCTGDLSCFTTEERTPWFLSHNPERTPIYVVGTGSKTIAWGCISPYRPGRQAFETVGEISYYVDFAHHRQGVGSRLVRHILAEARAMGYTHLLAILLECNEASLGLLQKFGFAVWGTLPGVARIEGHEYAHIYCGRRMDGMEDYTFALAQYGDIPEIVGVYRALAGTPGCTWHAEYPSQATAEEDIGNQSLYVLRKQSQIVAVASAGGFGELGHLEWKPRNPCELARIGVLPAMQNRGVGSHILRKVMQAMAAKGYDGIRMLVSQTNPAALAMYEKNGFERCGAVFMYEIDFYCYQTVFSDAVKNNGLSIS